MKFNTVKWSRRNLRGKNFGVHGKAYKYLPAGTQITFTPSNLIDYWDFEIGAPIWMWWRKNHGVLTDKNGKVYPLYGFVSKDNKEPLVRPDGHWTGRERTGLPIGMPMTLTLVGKGKIRVIYACASLNAGK